MTAASPSPRRSNEGNRLLDQWFTPTWAALSLGIIQPCPAATAKAGRKICDSPVSDLPLFGGAQ